MKTKKIIFALFAFLTFAFAQTPPPDILRLFSTRNMQAASAGFGPFGYNYIGHGRLDLDPSRDTNVMIYALRVEFRPDSVINTTGNGLFMRLNIDAHQRATDSITDMLRLGRIALSRTDRREFAWYAQGINGPYRFDRLPHDKTFFSDHLKSLRDYFYEVSNGQIKIGYRIFPQGDFGAFRLGREMAVFSPGSQRRDETNDEFHIRLARQMMRFVAESIEKANAHEENPFAGLRMNERANIVNEDGVPVFFLLIHAGSSALSDGGRTGNRDSPSDLTANFIGEGLFRFFNLPGENIFAGLVETYTAAGQTRTGARITSKDSQGRDSLIFHLSELMMVSSTANQDSLNWGINGILVNQFARQIGVPDLFSTVEGTTGIGSFGIMDFAGYVVGQGFIPPNPSAFTRSFMGWQTPTLALPGTEHRLTVGGDNLALVPINSTEYYLIENRQRNLTRDRELFAFDTIDGRRLLTQGFFNANLPNNIDSVSARGVIMRVKSRDIGIPASGALVWHIDEKIISNRLRHNLLNDEFAYRAVRLIEADGVKDIGVEFRDILGVSQWDYGTAGDVFPHTNIFEAPQAPVTIDRISPTTTPSSAANDGANSFLTLSFAHSRDTSLLFGDSSRFSRARSGKFQSFDIVNFSDSSIILTVEHADDLRLLSPHPNFPVRLDGVGGFFPLLTANVFDAASKDIVALSKDGRLSIISENGRIRAETVENPVNMPSFTAGNLFVPTRGRLLIFNRAFGGNEGFSNIQKTVLENTDISSYVAGFDDDSWVFGTNDGFLIFGRGNEISENGRIRAGNRAIDAIAIFDATRAAAVSADGEVFVVSRNQTVQRFSLPTNGRPIFSPFKIAVSGNNITVADNRQGLWFLTFYEEDGIKLHENWRGRREREQLPVDWAGIFRRQENRENIPKNHGFLSMASLTNDGNMHLILGGTNGIWAFDEKGNLLENYPAVLDRADWDIRQSVLGTPTTARTANGETMVIFTTTTGDSRSWFQTKVTRTDANRGIVWFNDFNGRPDSLTGLSAAAIDTIMTLNDGIIELYFAPGGLIDVRRGRTGRRPDLSVSNPLTGVRRIYPYLASIGDPLSQGVVLAPSGNTLYLTAVSDNGMLHRFGFPSHFSADESNVDMTGGNAARQFNFAPPSAALEPPSDTLEYFYSFPNPVRIPRGQNASVTFRYKLGGNASSVRLTVYTIQGQRVIDERNLRTARGVNEFVLNNLSHLGSAVYRARLEVRFGEQERVLFWKMAVLR